jgi:hypothetical protein
MAADSPEAPAPMIITSGWDDMGYSPVKILVQIRIFWHMTILPLFLLFTDGSFSQISPP